MRHARKDLGKYLAVLALMVAAATLFLGCTQTSVELGKAGPSEGLAQSEVDETSAVVGLQSDLQLDAEEYAPGAGMAVLVIPADLSDEAWVGIFPVPSDKLGERQAAISSLTVDFEEPMSLAAPLQPGNYRLLLIDPDMDGVRPVAERKFRVVP